MDNIRSISAKSSETAARPLVCAIAYDGLCTFEFGIAVELFALPRPEFDHWYRFAAVKAEAGSLRATGGIMIDAEDDLKILQKADLIVVPGWRGADAAVPATLCEALRSAYARGARIASICSGVFVLAAAGLLDGKVATTHWRYTDQLASQFSNVTIDPDVLFVECDGIYTSAGSAAGLDLGLHIIRQDFGARVAASVAKRLVIPAQRDGDQRQFVPRPEAQLRRATSLAALQDRIRETLNEDWPVARMADFAGTSKRSLARRFHEETGTTPIYWLRAERVGRAAELLETSNAHLSDVSDACGFGSTETFRKEFRKQMGVPPAKYRRRMGAS